MKLYVIVIFLPLILFSQNKEYNKLLFQKAITKEDIILTDKQIKINFPDIFFDMKGVKSLINFYTEKKDLVSIIKKTGDIIECKFYSDESIKIIKSNIISFSKNNYSSLNNDFDYKKYSEFVDRGLIVVIDNVEMKILLIRVDSCLFLDQKNYILKELKKQNKQDIYVFNCGGKELISIVK